MGTMQRLHYIYTCAASFSRVLYPEADFPVLNLLEAEGAQIEPEYLVPIIPMVLCNGTAGVGTGGPRVRPSIRSASSSGAMGVIRRSKRAYRRRDGHAAASKILHCTRPMTQRFQFIGGIEQTGPKTVRVRSAGQHRQLPLLRQKDDVVEGARPPQRVDQFDWHAFDITLQFESPVDDSCRATAGPAPFRSRFSTCTCGATVTVRRAGLIRCGRLRLNTRACRYLQPPPRVRDGAASAVHCAHYRRIPVLVKVIDSSGEFLFRRSKQDIVADLEADEFAPIDGGFDHLLEAIRRHRRALPNWPKIAPRRG